ncbi:arylamine N-acetyltransferase [Actinomycetospora lutea]|uniref:arylamine N-acetyltransferase family protein n=1 Tax=Actinomycetospora lutea TaxID=663604 RepID=UPI002366F039|nr:arylamine N-acetyltransferase [Actinomycetospora lutea]MDD7940206.1 arylamine N-acetyltransferase [Actinomycetospora lutea]
MTLDVQTAVSAALSDADVTAYLERIGLSGPSAPPTLPELTRAHVAAIPFENVDVVLGRHRGIALDVVVDKLVRRRRGGYCYEHARLFAAVLTHLGYRVRTVIARVQADRGGPRTHRALVVDDHLVDVGFGASMHVPMPLRDGVVVDQAGWDHRLEREDDGHWTLVRRTLTGEERAYRMDPQPSLPVDDEVAHHYTSTHPSSPFTGQLVVMRLAPGVSRRLVRRTLITEHADGRVEELPVTGEDVVDVLASLDVELDDEESAALRAWWSTQDRDR